VSNVIIFHGKGDDHEYYDHKYASSSNLHWIPWLQNECLINDLPAHTPEVFRVFDAKYEDWKQEFERYPITSETIVVTHSCSGGFLFRYLSENKTVRLKKWIAVAPWLDPLKFMQNTFGFDLFDFERDPNILDRVDEAIIFHSEDDQESIQLSIKEIQETWPDFPIRIFSGYGHFCQEDMGTQEFPELIEEVLR